MRAGSLRHTAVIYERSSTPDVYGALDHTMVADPITHKCSITQRTFRERAENGQLLSRIEFELRFRFSTDLEFLNPGAQIDINGRRLEVLSSADPDGKREQVVIYAEAVR